MSRPARPLPRPVVPRTIREQAILEVRVTGSARVPEESNRGGVPRAGKAVFPRSARLLRHADFERVYQQGRRHFSACMTVFYWARPEAGPVVPGLRVGFTVSRALGGAVQRNRLKRRLREAVRLSGLPAGVSADVVINPKKTLLAVEFTEVVNEVGRAFVVIQEKLGKTTAGSGERSSRK